MKNFTNLKKRFPKLASVKSIPRKNIQENENYTHLLDCVKDFGKITLVENGVEKQIFDEKTLDYVVSILSIAPNRKKAYKVALNLFTKATRAILCGQRIDLDAHTLHYASLFLSAALSDDFQKSRQSECEHDNEKSEKLPEWCQNKVIVDNTIDKVCIEIPTLFRDIIGIDKMQSILEETTKSILQKLRNENKLSPHQTSEENVIFLIS